MFDLDLVLAGLAKGMPSALAYWLINRRRQGLNWKDELDKREHVREPPVPVIVSRPLDDEEWPGLLYGWADSPSGLTGGLRGLVTYRRTIGPGYTRQIVEWVKADSIRKA